MQFVTFQLKTGRTSKDKAGLTWYNNQLYNDKVESDVNCDGYGDYLTRCIYVYDI